MAPESTIDRSLNQWSKWTFMRARVSRWSSTARASPHSSGSAPSGISAAQSTMYWPW